LRMLCGQCYPDRHRLSCCRIAGGQAIVFFPYFKCMNIYTYNWSFFKQRFSYPHLVFVSCYSRTYAVKCGACKAFAMFQRILHSHVHTFLKAHVKELAAAIKGELYRKRLNSTTRATRESPMIRRMLTILKNLRRLSKPSLVVILSMASIPFVADVAKRYRK